MRLRSTDFPRLPHCLGRFAPCGYAHPPGDAGCGDFVTFAMAALPVADRLPADAGHRAAGVDVDADGVDGDGGYTVCV